MRLFKKLFGRKQGAEAFSSGDVVQVHIVGPDGYEEIELTIGRDVPEEKYRSFCDQETGDLFALKVFRDGQPTVNIVLKTVYDSAGSQFSGIDRAAEEHAERRRKMFEEFE